MKNYSLLGVNQEMRSMNGEKVSAGRFVIIQV